MSLLKSIYISLYLTLSTALVLYAGWRVSYGASIAGWFGVLLASAPVLAVIGWLMVFKSRARTNAQLPALNLLGLAGVCLSLWARLTGDVDSWAVSCALVGWLGFLGYAFWYSRLARRPSESLRVGRPLPTFAIRGVDGVLVSSVQLRGQPTVYLFYRGNWCPLCMAQVKELAARYRELEAMGVRVALVSPQPHANTVGLASRMQVRFDFYTDEGNRAARMLGIDNPHGLPMGMQMMGYDSETVLPTVIITDREGRVVWVHETDNYRVRPEPELFLRILSQHASQ